MILMTTLHLSMDPLASLILMSEYTAPSTDRVHLQGYIELLASTRFNAVRRLLPDGTHIEPRHGTARQAIEYCKKDGRFGVFGEPATSAQGERSDLSLACEAIEAGTALSEVAAEHPSTYVRYHRGLERYRDIRRGPSARAGDVVSVWLYGPTGIGKTREAWRAFPDAYCKDPDTTWWCGYDGHSAVIIDDFRAGGKLSIPYLLRLLDRYIMSVQVKGGHVWMTAHQFVITTPHNINTTFQAVADMEDLAQLHRRIVEFHFHTATQVGCLDSIFSLGPDPGDQPV